MSVPGLRKTGTVPYRKEKGEKDWRRKMGGALTALGSTRRGQAGIKPAKAVVL